MARLPVLMVETARDVTTEGIAGRLRALADMRLVGVHRGVDAAQVAARVPDLPETEPALLMVFGPHEALRPHVDGWLALRPQLLVLMVDHTTNTMRYALCEPSLRDLLARLRQHRAQAEIVDDRIAITAPAQGLEALLDVVRELTGLLRGRAPAQLRAVPRTAAAPPAAPPAPLMGPVRAWLERRLAQAVAAIVAGDVAEGQAFGAEDVAARLYSKSFSRAPREPGSQAVLEGERRAHQAEVDRASRALDDAVAAARDGTDPLARMAALGLSSTELRILALTLAPEIDPGFQRSMVLLQNEALPRVGTLGLHASLLGDAGAVRGEIGSSGRLARWRVFDGCRGWPAADEPVRIDAPLAAWLMGDPAALEDDVRVRRLLRPSPWAGAALLRDAPEAESLAAALAGEAMEGRWLVLADVEASTWLALIEAATAWPLRIDGARLAGHDVVEIGESGLRLGRLARLERRTCVVDASGCDASRADDDGLRVLLAAIGATDCSAVLVGLEAARAARLLSPQALTLREGVALGTATRGAAIEACARSAGAVFGEEAVNELALRVPIGVEGLDVASRLAAGRAREGDTEDERCDRMLAAAQGVAAEGLSHFAERLRPAFDLDQVILPRDRREQLDQVVDSVRFAGQVLDEWKFGEQLPYGRGCGVLLHGPSGVGKSMACLAIARAVGAPEVLRFDASKALSRWLGDNEKAMDRIFRDAERSGCPILIDECDAFLHRRSDGARNSSAQERYSDMEISFLLMRLEAFTGLLLMTTNLKQNIDPAFLRRLRFVIEFPRPDAEARERIWRGCLPRDSHQLADADFRLVARRVELTGGNIRQISLRAAFMAAAGRRRIALGDIERAAAGEYAKLGMPAVSLEAERRRAA